MKVFVYEHLCASAAGDATCPQSLLVEGRAMLSAVLADFARIPDVECLTLSNDSAAAFLQLAANADFTLVIAPELDDILLSRCRWVEEAGGRLLGPTAAAVELTADKAALADHLARHSIPTPPCRPWHKGSPVEFGFPCVVKPRFGAGSHDIFVLNTEDEVAAVTGNDFILQPFVPGQAASVAFLIGPRQRLALQPASQFLSTDGRLRYLGGKLPLDGPAVPRAVRLAGQAVAAVAGLSGYVGVDLVVGPAADGSQDYVIEINPRLTTSYVGLRTLAQTNLVEVMLRVARDEAVPEVQWKSQGVRFWADGRVDPA